MLLFVTYDNKLSIFGFEKIVKLNGQFRCITLGCGILYWAFYRQINSIIGRFIENENNPFQERVHCGSLSYFQHEKTTVV